MRLENVWLSLKMRSKQSLRSLKSASKIKEEERTISTLMILKNLEMRLLLRIKDLARKSISARNFQSLTTSCRAT
jgi:hypothetical protein